MLGIRLLFLFVFLAVSSSLLAAKERMTHEEWRRKQKNPTMAPEYTLRKWLVPRGTMKDHADGILPGDVNEINFLRGPAQYWKDVRNGEGIECTKLYKELLYSPSKEQFFITARCGTRYAGYQYDAVVEVWQETDRSKKARDGKIRPPSEFQLVGAWDLPGGRVIPARIEGGVAVSERSKAAPMPQGGSVAQTKPDDCTGKTGLALQLCKLEKVAKSQPGAPDPSAIAGTVGR
jgi:hypothetical protein